MSYERQWKVYIDTKSLQLYSLENGTVTILAALAPKITSGELVNAVWQLTDGEPVFTNGVLQNAYTGFAGSGASGEIIVDNNFNWWDTCALGAALTASTSVSSIQITGLASAPRALGTIYLSAADIVHYNAWTKTGDTYTFITSDSSFTTASFTPAENHSLSAAVRIYEQPIIVSASNDDSGRNTGLFSGLLDAANPVYEGLIEGLSQIRECYIEFNLYVNGRVVFRARNIFDCLSAMSHELSTPWVRPSVWTAADSRYVLWDRLQVLDSTAAPFVKYDLVRFGSPVSSYQCISDTGAASGETPTTHPAKWKLIAEHGATGNPGPANTLSIGTVTEGDTPSASITGTAPNQTLNLVLRAGAVVTLDSRTLDFTISVDGETYSISTGTLAADRSYIKFTKAQLNGITDNCGYDLLELGEDGNYHEKDIDLTLDKYWNSSGDHVIARIGTLWDAGSYRLRPRGVTGRDGEDYDRVTVTSNTLTVQRGPKEYYWTAVSGASLVIDRSAVAGLDKVILLIITMPSPAVSFSWPSGISWKDIFGNALSSAPDMSTPGEYHFAFKQYANGFLGRLLGVI